MSLWSSWTPCDESRPCAYNDFIGNKKGCNILNPSKDGGAPYPDGECSFWKPPKKKGQDGPGK